MGKGALWFISFFDGRWPAFSLPPPAASDNSLPEPDPVLPPESPEALRSRVRRYGCNRETDRLPRRRQSPEKRPPASALSHRANSRMPGVSISTAPQGSRTACRCTVVCRPWASFTRISPVFITVSFVSALIRLDFPTPEDPAAPPTVPAEAALPVPPAPWPCRR